MHRYSAVLAAAFLGGLVVFKGVSWGEPPRNSQGPEGYRTSNFQSVSRETAPDLPTNPEQIVLTNCQIKIFQEVPLSAEKAGVLDMVASEGQSVKQGDLVAHTRDDLVKATLAVATRQSLNDVEIRFAKKASELAQVEYERDLQANSIVPGTVSDLTLRSHRLAAEKALLQLEQAETALEIEKLRRNETVELLRLHSMISPINAEVRAVFKKRGESVAEGEPILELINTSRVKVEGYVHLRDLDSVQMGSVVNVQLDIPDVDLPIEGLTFPGRIAFVDLKVEPVTHRVKVWAEVSNQNGVLKDGLTARMVIDRRQVDHNFAASRQAPKN
jgi:multidrug efflux pump subunit AcrA (membrane-fusion protein)